jgi:hypothetical protein
MAGRNSMVCAASKAVSEVYNALRSQDLSTFPARLAVGRLCRWMDRSRRRPRSRATSTAPENVVVGVVPERRRTRCVGRGCGLRGRHSGGSGGISRCSGDLAGLFASNARSGAPASYRPRRPAFIRPCRPDGSRLAGASPRTIRFGGLGDSPSQSRKPRKNLRVLSCDIWSSRSVRFFLELRSVCRWRRRASDRASRRWFRPGRVRLARRASRYCHRRPNRLLNLCTKVQLAHDRMHRTLRCTPLSYLVFSIVLHTSQRPLYPNDITGVTLAERMGVGRSR